MVLSTYNEPQGMGPGSSLVHKHIHPLKDRDPYILEIKPNQKNCREDRNSGKTGTQEKALKTMISAGPQV